MNIIHDLMERADDVLSEASRGHSTVTNHPSSRIEPTLPVFRQDEFSFLSDSVQNIFSARASASSCIAL
jgi:hypothetical protein